MTPSPPQPPALHANDSDTLLVQRTLSGDSHAYDLLVLKYQRRVQRLISRMVSDPAQVQDIVQETFFKAWRALPQFRGDAQFYTWLYRIAINCAKRSLSTQSRSRVHSHSSLQTTDADEETLPAAHESITYETPESVLAAQEIAQAVHAALQDLPTELAQALTLREIEGLSYEDIARAMDCPIGTVRSRIFRAREAISARIKPLLSHQSGKRW